MKIQNTKGGVNLKYTKTEVTATLSRVARRLGHVPSRREYRNLKAQSAPASDTIERMFNGSWSRATRTVRG